MPSLSAPSVPPGQSGPARSSGQSSGPACQSGQSGQPGQPGPGEELSLFAGRPWTALLVVSTGAFMSTLDGNIVSVALPVVAGHFHASLPYAQWIVSAYLLVICCALPLFGRLGDAKGKRPVYRAGFLLFGAASALCGLAGSMETLIAARVLQGVGGAMLMANGPGIIVLAFPGTSRGRAFGVMGSAVALGSLAGPALGGVLLGAFGWSSIFYINIPVALAGAVCVHMLLPRGEPAGKAGFDAAGMLLFSVGVTALLMTLSHGRDWPVRGLVAGAVFAFMVLGLFVRVERRAKRPMVDMGLLSHWPFLAGNLGSFLCFAALFTNAILMPFYLHDVKGLSPMLMGGVLALLPLVMAVVSPFSGLMSERISQSALTGAGLLIVAAGLVNQGLLDQASPLWRACLGQMAVGLGVSAFVPPNNASTLSSAPAGKSGLAGSILALIRNIGMVTGVAVATGVFETARLSYLRAFASPTAAEITAGFLSGFRCALFTGAALAAIGAGVSFFRKAGVRPKSPASSQPPL